MTVESTPERVIKTLLLTDLVDSTALVHAVGDSRAAQIFERHDYIARDLLVRHDGIEIDKTDGFLFIFDRPIHAVNYVIAFHDAVAELSSELDVKLAARAGIHLGEVYLRKNRPEHVTRGAKPLELEGLAKPMAARIMSLAMGTQTLMTRSAFDLARRAAVGQHEFFDDVEWIDHGPYEFKGIAEPQSVCEVGRKSRAPLVPPPDSEKAWRVGTKGKVETIEWRPAGGLPVPTRSAWTLERKLGEGSSGEVWLAGRQQDSAMEATLSISVDEHVYVARDRRAMLFCLEHGQGSARGTARWKLQDPVACVIVTSGNQQGHFVVLTDKVLTAGRDPSMDLQLHDPKVSRTHFELHRIEGGYCVRALRAKNGVFVNGMKIEEDQRLQNGDEIRAGQTELVFYEDSGDLN